MDNSKQDCKYWDKCYQRNPEHRQKYNHPSSVTAAVNLSPNKRVKATDSPSPRKNKKVSPSKRSPNRDDNLENERKKFKKSPDRSSAADEAEAGTSSNRGKSPASSRDSRSPSSRSRSRSRSPNTDRKSRTPDIKGKDEGSASENMPQSDNGGVKPTEAKPERKEMDITKEYDEVLRNLAGNPRYEPDVVRYSQKAEYQELLKTPKVFMRHMFLVEMPSDFFKFWEFCEQVAKAGQKPETILEKIGLKLVGPFNCLAGNFDKVCIKEPGEYLRYWRFYYDPPEFQTVFAKMKTGIHYGYWRDDPKDSEDLLMARNDANKGCTIDFVGANCFETILYYLDNDAGLTPFNRPAATAFRKSMETFIEANSISLDGLKDLKKKRDRKVVCRTFHGAGLVVPYDRKSELGYRGLTESDAKLKKILTRFERAKGDQRQIAAAMEELQPFITAANIAVDECDFGTAIELGLDLFCSGHRELHNVINGLLVTGYSMVDRPQFIAIIKTHLEDRSKDVNWV